MSSVDSCNSTSLHNVLKNCADIQSNESLFLGEMNNIREISKIRNNMIPANSYSIGSVSGSTYAIEESDGGTMLLEENGRISLAYENLRTIPRHIAETFAAQTKFLDLSYNNLENLSFLSFFEDLNTLILDRNVNLDVNTLPYLPNLKILWINNCDIKNTAEWIDTIERQCPSLNHLSMMGNRGRKNYYSLPLFTVANSTTHPVAIGDLREYILHVMPNLKYLNGVLLRNNRTVRIPSFPINVKSSRPSPNENSTSDNNLHCGKIASPTLSFRDLFRLRKRKPSSSSTTSN